MRMSSLAVWVETRVKVKESIAVSRVREEMSKLWLGFEGSLANYVNARA